MPQKYEITRLLVTGFKACIRSACFREPDGHLIEINQPLKQN